MKFGIWNLKKKVDVHCEFGIRNREMKKQLLTDGQQVDNCCQVPVITKRQVLSTDCQPVGNQIKNYLRTIC